MNDAQTIFIEGRKSENGSQTGIQPQKHRESEGGSCGKKKTYIYTLSEPETGRIRYVGKANNLKRRMYGHLNEAKRNGKTKKDNWIKKLQKLGKSPVMEIIEEVEEKNWEQAEQFWIVYLRFLGFNLCNLDAGGIGGQRRSEETIEKLRITSTGRLHSEETKKRMSEMFKGIPKKSKHVKKVSEALRGRKQPKESIKKRTESRIAKNGGFYTKQTPEDAEVQKHIIYLKKIKGLKHSEICKIYGFCKDTCQNICSGKTRYQSSRHKTKPISEKITLGYEFV
jgi:ribosomal protein L25 (general stress protein Ctc)